MGCGSSANQIHVASTATTVDNTKNDVSLMEKPPRGNSSRPTSNTVQSRNKSAGGKSKRSAWGGSTDSLGDDRSLASDVRGGSATSKASKHSGDSGFDDEGNKFITEGSHPNQIQEVEEGFNTPRDLELGVVGQACTQRLSAKDKDRLQEQRVMAALQQEGLITRPMSRAAFGVSFEVVEAPGAGGEFLPRRPPARLAKLEKRKKRRKLTEEELVAKMERTEERRKEREQERIAKIQSVSMKSDVSNALDAFAARQEVVKTEAQAKEEQAIENREKKLNEMRDKIRAKQEHAELVRKRRAFESTEPNTEELNVFKSQVITEDTPIGVKQ